MASYILIWVMSSVSLGESKELSDWCKVLWDKTITLGKYEWIHIYGYVNRTESIPEYSLFCGVR